MLIKLIERLCQSLQIFNNYIIVPTIILVSSFRLIVNKILKNVQFIGYYMEEKR